MKNSPKFWQDKLIPPTKEDHKYTRGQVTLLGGMEMTGATCLAAHAASRTGAGMITIISPTFHYQKKPDAVDPTIIYRSYRPNFIVLENTSITDHLKQSEPKGRNVCVIGPGLGTGNGNISRSVILSVLQRKTPVVLDADAFNVFQSNPKELVESLHEDVVLTPHAGEFKRLFPNFDTTPKDASERAVNNQLFTMVYKGAHTVIARQGKDTIINDNAPPSLATAGSGDVLTGLIAGLMATGMKPYDAACAGVWIHGKVASLAGFGLVSSDLPDFIPKVMQELLGITN